jgi:rubredoxin
MPNPDAQRVVCDICQNEFLGDVLKEAAPEKLVTQIDDCAVCPACRIVYDFDPIDDGCLACSVPTERLSSEGYHFEITFPVHERDDSPLAEITGTLCGDCAAQIGIDLLFSSITNRASAHERLLDVLEQQNDQFHSYERHDQSSLTEQRHPS